MNRDHRHRARHRPPSGSPVRLLASIAFAIPAAARPFAGVLALGTGLALVSTATADEGHPRWKEFVTWLLEKKRTADEDLILRYILSGGSRFTWLDVYAHSMQEQTEALFRRWLEREGNPRRIPNLSNRADGNARR